jgi:hypothetical protein
LIFANVIGGAATRSLHRLRKAGHGDQPFGAHSR